MTTTDRPRPDQLLDRVREHILATLGGSASWIKQDRLAADLGVSKIPLREVLARLEQEGLVISEANRGFFVSPLSRQEADEVFALRLQLEPKAIAAAALLASDAEQAEVIDLHARLDSATRQREPAAPSLNRAFHIALVRPSRQAVTIAFLERLHVLAERYVRKHLEPLERGRRAVGEHDELVSAWLARDATRAAALTRRHISHTLKDLVRQLPYQS
jgi:DNA-binding GntR family transcriptional regulator